MAKIKLETEDFIFEVTEELVCYDEIGREGADKWAADFRTWLADGRKKKNIVTSGGKTYFVIEDEGEIFDIADEYLDAVENSKTDEYWKNFQ
ncbi:MAG: hypothetical protein IJ062_02165 [Firmicutes bacterium]|nr:hypothetical protein [Bacillota bacterium]